MEEKKEFRTREARGKKTSEHVAERIPERMKDHETSHKCTMNVDLKKKSNLDLKAIVNNV